LRSKSARVAAIGVAVSALLLSFWPTADHWVAREPDLAWVAQADLLGMRLAGALSARASEQPEVVSVGVAVVPGYQNPFRDVSGLIPERVDMGVDFGGAGQVYALGHAVITNATGNSAGWPGGGWITYKLTDGPDAGLTVYLAEDVTPAAEASLPRLVREHGDRALSSNEIGGLDEASELGAGAEGREHARRCKSAIDTFRAARCLDVIRPLPRDTDCVDRSGARGDVFDRGRCDAAPIGRRSGVLLTDRDQAVVVGKG